MILVACARHQYRLTLVTVCKQLDISRALACNQCVLVLSPAQDSLTCFSYPKLTSRRRSLRVGAEPALSGAPTS